MNKVSQGFYAAESAAVAILGVANPIAWIVGGVLRVAGAATQMASGDWMGGASNLFGGHIGGRFADLMREEPSATVLSHSLDYQDSSAVASADGTYRTSHSRDSGSVLLDTAFGVLSFRLNAIGDNWEAVTEETVNTFLPLLKVTQAFDKALSTSISITDALTASNIDTMARFRSLFTHQFESQKDIKGLSSASLVAERMDDIAVTMGKVGTKAGDAMSVWWDAFSQKLFKPMTDTNNEYNTVTAFNVEAFLAARLSELAELPKSLAKLFVASVKSVADGATQEQFQQQFTDFFSGWEYAKAGLAKVGIDIEQTAIPEYLSSLVGLGLTVGESSKALVSYASTFDKAAGDVTAQFNEAFNQIFAYAKANGEDKAQTAGRIGSYLTLANTAKDIGLTATNTELDNLAKQLNATAIAASADANAVIDRTIAEQGLIGISREAAIQQLVLAGDLDETKIAAADFSSALVEAQKTMFGGISLAQGQAVFLGTTLDHMGLTFNDIANIGTNLTGTFKDMAEAMDFFDRVAKAVYSEEEYAFRKKEQAKATFASASKQAGLGDYYTQDQFNTFFRDTGSTGFSAMMLKAIGSGDRATSTALEALASSYVVLNEREKSYQSSIQQTAKDTQDAIDKAKQLADLQKDVNAQILRFSQSPIEQQIQDAKDNIDKLTASAAEAGGELSDLGKLLTANLKDIVKTWGQPILDSFHLLEVHGNDFLNSLAGLKTKYAQQFADAKVLDSAGALKAAGTTLPDVNTMLSANYNYEIKSTGQSLIDEYNSYVPGRVQSEAVAAIYVWKDTMMEHAQELADLYHVPLSELALTVNTIADGRYTAAMKEAVKATETFSASIHDWVVKQRTTIIGTPMEQFKVAQDDLPTGYGWRPQVHQQAHQFRRYIHCKNSTTVW
jgi:hypothetical protein